MTHSEKRAALSSKHAEERSALERRHAEERASARAEERRENRELWKLSRGARTEQAREPR